MKSLRRKSEHGNAMLEFAVGWSILWLLFSGVYQIGYAYYTYNALLVSTANAVELGSRLGYDTGSPGTYTTALKNMVLYGDETAGTSTVVPKLLASNVNVHVGLDSTGTPRDVTITISGYTINAIFTSYTLPNKPRATALYTGQISCSTC
jgi:hypothetical protein